MKFDDEQLLVCECGWTGRNREILTAKNPFNEDERLIACPECRCIADHNIHVACYVLDCKEVADCGIKEKNGRYRVVCRKHYREITELNNKKKRLENHE